MSNYTAGRAFAEECDKKDALARLRDFFYTKEGQIYMDGNSLGLCSKTAEAAVNRAVSDWKEYGINLWTGAPTNYFLYHDVIGKKLAKIINANEDEVTVCANTTLNVHQIIATFYKPTAERNKVVIDSLNFPTDRYAVESQLESRGYKLEEVLRVIESRDGTTLAEEDILASFTEDVALVLLPSVLYRSSQLLDLKKLTAAAHEKGILIGFDLCHSIGNVDHDFKEIDCDFALWCDYKYLSGGPGAVAGLYVNRRHFDKQVGLAGWWGNRKDTQFELRDHYEPVDNAGAWQTGTGCILSLASIDGALDVFENVQMKDLRAKSLDLTGYLMYLIDNELAKYGFTVGNPREDAGRGGHVALQHEDAIRINEALKAAKVIPDFRYPNVIRLAPVPQYTRYVDVYDMVERIKEIMETKAYEKYAKKAGTVA